MLGPEYMRITAKLDRAIPLHNVPGNHDVGNEPMPETIAAYRERFGPDHYTFRSGDLVGIVLNSSALSAARGVGSAASYARFQLWHRRITKGVFHAPAIRSSVAYCMSGRVTLILLLQQRHRRCTYVAALATPYGFRGSSREIG